MGIFIVFFIIIAAGHIWKFVTLAYIPPTIAGMVLVYRGKYLAGGFLTALFVALQILSNHPQMSYYFLFVMLFMAVAYGVMAYRDNKLKEFVKASGVLVLAGLIGVCVNISNLYHTYQYSKESMRGKSELVKENSANQTDSGLERDYITQWSYGIGETFSLLVPNVKGGASVPLAANEDAMKRLIRCIVDYTHSWDNIGVSSLERQVRYMWAHLLYSFLLWDVSLLKVL